MGIEVAEHLAGQGRASTVIEMRDAILVEMGEMRKTATQLSLSQEPITVLTNATCTAIADGTVTVEVDGAEKDVPADVVIMAVGSKPRPTGRPQGGVRGAVHPVYRSGRRQGGAAPGARRHPRDVSGGSRHRLMAEVPADSAHGPGSGASLPGLFRYSAVFLGMKYGITTKERYLVQENGMNSRFYGIL